MLALRSVVIEGVTLFSRKSESPNGRGVRLTGGLYFAVMFVYYEYYSKPARLAAVSTCLSGFPSSSYLCHSMGVKYHDYHPLLSDLDEFSAKIPDPEVYTWAQTGSEQRPRLVEIGTVYRNSANGTAFEAKREPGGPGGGSMEYFRMCRANPCTFTGGQNSQDPVKGRPIVHITGVAYSDSADAVLPPVALVGDAEVPVPSDLEPVGIAPTSTKYWKGGLAAVIFVVDSSSKAKSDWGKLSIEALITCRREV